MHKIISKEFYFEGAFPKVEEISERLQCMMNAEYGSVKLVTAKGVLTISKRWNGGYGVRFPNNYNAYSVRSNASGKTLANVISRDIDKLSWMDFHYVHPDPFLGSIPSTLDELCVYYQQLRMKARVSQDEKDYVQECFAKLIYEETKYFSSILEMPFKSLHLHRGGKRTIASTDCSGKITFNSRFLFDDADTIRFFLVHELCHSKTKGHSKAFSELLENSMLKCNLISRPCVCSPQLTMSNGARFPIGKYCPGYNFLKGLKGESVQSNFLGKKSIWIKNDGH